MHSIPTHSSKLIQMKAYHAGDLSIDHAVRDQNFLWVVVLVVHGADHGVRVHKDTVARQQHKTSVSHTQYAIQ